MVQDPADLAVHDADQLGADGNLNAQQTLDRQAEGVLLIHRRHIVEAVEIGDVLEVGAVLHQLFSAAMQQADMRVNPLDHFAVQLQHKTQNAVGRRVLGSEVDIELADRRFRNSRCLRGVVSHYFASALSSPGRT